MNEEIRSPAPEEEVSGEDIMTKFDKESKYRRLAGLPAKLVFVIGVCWSLFHLYTGLFGTFPSTLQRAPHLGAALVLVYLLYPAGKKITSSIPIYDYILAGCVVFCTGYHVVNYEALLLRSGLYTTLDIVVSALAILLLLEAARRVAGPVISCLSIVFLCYAFLGDRLPGFLYHAPMTFKRVVCFEWLGTEGILGSPIYVSSSFIFLFLVFATFLKASGVGDWMTGLAMGAVGGYAGGPAKAAVVASALQGTVSGSSVANTVSTGSITIPLMKKTGYRPEFAGAVEAAASTGGQLMPPIMGAAAFIMTEYIGCSYGTVALAACIPALLYFTGIFTNVHFEALKHNLRGIPKDKRPAVVQLLKEGWYMVTPIVVIVVLLVMGRSAMRSAMFGILSCLVIWVINIIKEKHSFDVKEFFIKFIKCLDESARSAIAVATACGCAGIIVGVVTMTGLGLKMANGIVGLAGGSLILTAVFTMLCSLILGMGVPTTANYIIQATISAPALVACGVPAIAAHLFVFYFGIVADITPPVALAAFAGAGIAKSNPIKTGFNAFRLGIGAYIVPYIFIFNPILVLVNPGYESGALFGLMAVKAVITAFFGILGVATGFTGYFHTNCKLWERPLLMAAGICLISPSTLTDVIGVVVMAAVYVIQRLRTRKAAKV